MLQNILAQILFGKAKTVADQTWHEKIPRKKCWVFLRVIVSGSGHVDQGN